MSKIHFLSSLLLLALILGSTSCNKDDDDNQPLEAVTLDLLVDSKVDGDFSLFSFEQGEVVSGAELPTNNWDFGLRLTTFITNGGVSGPGQGGALVLNGVFDEITEAPAEGYRVDAQGDLAITDGSWYDYNPVTRAFAPKAGVVFVFRTAKGNYAKMELIKADPTDDNGTVVTPPTVPTKIKYTLRYVYQGNGSRNF
jgi:hypothetical protein